MKGRAVPLEEVSRDDRSVVTVGTFDGVHLGHQALLRYVLGRAADRGGRSTVVTFEPHPREVVHGEAVRLLSTLDERAELIREQGIDLVVAVRFTPEFARMSAEDFVRNVLVRQIGLQEIVIGYDFSFGRGREGDARLLRQIGQESGFTVDVLPAEIVDAHVVSSSAIRDLLVEEGDVAGAKRLLGRRYALSAEVVRGDGRGRTIGYPTANLRPLDTRKVVPKQGVYAVRVKSSGSPDWYGAMMNIGRRPTFGGNDLQIEAHLFDFEADLYGATLTVEFVERMREERRFSSVEDLVQQLSRDEERCRAVLGTLS
ncbi:MAG TPA: bifunctional riboflavin kinase/FAD synthetase [Rhodothermales bacterium]